MARTVRCMRWWSQLARLALSSAREERPSNSYRYIAFLETLIMLADVLLNSAVSTMKTYIIIFNCMMFQERAGVKMILIQDASQGPNVDKPLRIIGDPYKVQVRLRNLIKFISWCWVAVYCNHDVFLLSKPRRWCRRFWGRETTVALVKELTSAPEWEEAWMWVCACGSNIRSGIGCLWTKSKFLKTSVFHSDPRTATLSRCGHWAQWRDDQENPEWCWS